MSSYLSSREFRPILFRRLFDIIDISIDLLDILEKCIHSGKVLIQDSLDMKIEEFTVEELRMYEQKYGVIYQSLIYDNVVERYIALDKYLNVHGADSETKYFLNNTLSVTCKILNDTSDIFKYLSSSTDVRYVHDVCALIVFDKIKEKSFTFKVVETEESLYLLINEKLVCCLDIDLVDDSCYFELVQICKTKSGYDLVLSFSSTHYYCGLQLSDDLSLVSVVNFSNCVVSTSVTKDFTNLFAKSKLLHS